MKALIVIDYSYDFIADDGKLTVGKNGQAIEESILKHMKNFLSNGDLVVITMDYHRENDESHPESKLFPPHNIVGTKGRELYGSIKDFYEENKENENLIFLDKERYSSFYKTTLDEILKKKDIKDIYLTGVCTDICVLHTAVDAYNLGYNINVYSDSVASFNENGHDVSLQHFKNSLGANIL